VRLLFSIWIFPSHCLSISPASWHHLFDDNRSNYTQHTLSTSSVISLLFFLFLFPPFLSFLFNELLAITSSRRVYKRIEFGYTTF
jgi:hypothetical protein